MSNDIESSPDYLWTPVTMGPTSTGFTEIQVTAIEPVDGLRVEMVEISKATAGPEALAHGTDAALDAALAFGMAGRAGHDQESSRVFVYLRDPDRRRTGVGRTNFSGRSARPWPR